MKRLRLPLRLVTGVLALSVITNASAQHDEFDAPAHIPTAPSPPSIPSAPTSEPAPAAIVDVRPSDAALARVVRVLAVHHFATVDSSCTSGHLARGDLRSGLGIVSDDGTRVVVPSSVVYGASAIAVHGDDRTALRAAVLVRHDVASRLTILSLVTPFDTVAAMDAATAPTYGSAVTTVTRGVDGTLDLEDARVLIVRNDRESTVSLNRYGADTSVSRVVFHGGRAVGYLLDAATTDASSASNTLALASFVEVDAGDAAAAAPAAETAATYERVVASVVGDAAAPSSTGLCEAIRARPAPPVLDSLPTDLPRGARLLLAVEAWNAAVVAEGIEPGPASRPYALLDSADAAETNTNAHVPFVVYLRRLASDASERERIAEAERARRDTRNRRSDTYTLGLSSGFARDGSSGLSGAMLSVGAFGTFPKLAAERSLVGGFVVGGSTAIGANSGFSGLLTLDLGGTLRIGTRHRAFALATYSPGVLRTRLDGGSAFAAAGLRVALGITFARSATYVGYRMMAPRSDFPLHMLELGMLLRYGQPPPATADVAETGTSTDL